MVHFAVAEALNSSALTWMEKVTDEEYRTGPARGNNTAGIRSRSTVRRGSLCPYWCWTSDAPKSALSRVFRENSARKANRGAPMYSDPPQAMLACNGVQLHNASAKM